MFNLHLLKKDLTPEEYTRDATTEFHRSGHPGWEQPSISLVKEKLPDYVIARCPICLAKNIEKLNTYTTDGWRAEEYSQVRPGAFFDSFFIVHHCKHFALGQYFIIPEPRYEVWKPSLSYKPPYPYVVGHLLESKRCLSVIHALPICRIEGEQFVPYYTLFLISYFAQEPQKVVTDIHNYNSPRLSLEASAMLYLPLKYGEPYWADLSFWVREGKLYWVDGDDPNLSIRTHDVVAFPYGNLASK